MISNYITFSLQMSFLSYINILLRLSFDFQEVESSYTIICVIVYSLITQSSPSGLFHCLDHDQDIPLFWPNPSGMAKTCPVHLQVPWYGLVMWPYPSILLVLIATEPILLLVGNQSWLWFKWLSHLPTRSSGPLQSLNLLEVNHDD